MKKVKYKIFTNSANDVIAVSTYAGKTVKGIAKCDPRDTFDIDKGVEIAEARCARRLRIRDLQEQERNMQKQSEC